MEPSQFSIVTSAGVSEIRSIPLDTLDTSLERLERAGFPSGIDDLAIRAVVVLEGNDEGLIREALTFENEEEDDIDTQPTEAASMASSVSRASASSIATISSAPSDNNDGIKARLTALFLLDSERTPRLAALQKYIMLSFKTTAASLSSMLSSSASDGRALIDASRVFIDNKYTTVLRPYFIKIFTQLKSLNPKEHFTAIYSVSKNIRAGILAIRHSYSLGRVIGPIIKSIFVTLGNILYVAGGDFITWLHSNRPEWLVSFLEILYEAGSAILQVSMDDALGMGESTEVVPVLLMLATVLLVYDKFGPGAGLGVRLQALFTNAYTKLIRVGEAIIAQVISLRRDGYNLAIRCWNSTRQIREIYTDAVGALHIPFYVVATITTMSAKALYLAIENLYEIVIATGEGLERLGAREGVVRAAGILESLKDLETRAQGLEGRQNKKAQRECSEITRQAEAQVDLLLALDALLAEAARLEAEAEGAPTAKKAKRKGGARKSKSRRRRGPTVNKKQKKSRRYKRSNNRGGSRKNKKATKKRRN